MTESQVDIAYGHEMWIGRTAIVEDAPVTTWTEIMGIEQLAFPEKSPEDVDVTHMKSPGRSRESIPGLMPVADTAQEKQYWPEDDGDVLLETLAVLTETGAKENVMIEFHRPGAARRTYRGYVNSFIPGGTVGDKEMVTVNLKLFERLSSNPRTIAP
jgi:hypothetical protein